MNSNTACLSHSLVLYVHLIGRRLRLHLHIYSRPKREEEKAKKEIYRGHLTAAFLIDRKSLLTEIILFCFKNGNVLGLFLNVLGITLKEFRIKNI